MLTTFDNRPINRQLLDATSAGNVELVEKLLANGANPFALIQTEVGPRSIFMNTLSMGKSKILAIILNYARKEGKSIDLSQPIPITDPQNRNPMNIIQFAIRDSSRSCWIMLEDYYLEQHTAKSYSSVINKPFDILYSGDKYHKETLGHVLVKTISTYSIASNSALYKDGKKSDALNHSFAYWLAHSEDISNAPDEIHYDGPICALEYTISRGLDVLATNFKGISVVAQGHELLDALEDEETFKKVFLSKVLFAGIKVLDVYVIDGKSRVNATIPNLFRSNLFETAIVIDYKKVVQKLDEAERIQTAPVAPSTLQVNKKLEHHDKQLQQHNTQLQQHAAQLENHETRLVAVEKLCAKFAQTAEMQLMAVRENLVPHQAFLKVFNTLQRDTAGLIRQLCDGKLKVFAQKPSKQDRTAHAVLGLFSFTLQACPVTPFASVIPALGQVFLNIKTELHHARTNNAISNATLGVSHEALATTIASFVTAEAMHTYGANRRDSVVANLGTTLFAKIRTQIEKMATTTFHDLEDVVAFICSTAVADLQAAKRKQAISNSSSGSTSSDEHTPRVAITNGDTTPVKKPAIVTALKMAQQQQKASQAMANNTNKVVQLPAKQQQKASAAKKGCMIM